MSYTYAENMRDVLVSDLSQFQVDDSGTNLGVGYTGWDQAYLYARKNGLTHFGSVFLATGEDQNVKAFAYGMWEWMYYVRLHVKFEVEGTPDEDVANLADAVLASLSNADNTRTIAPGGYVKINAANYIGSPENIEDVTYLTIEFLVSVKEQFGTV